MMSKSKANQRCLVIHTKRGDPGAPHVERRSLGQRAREQGVKPYLTGYAWCGFFNVEGYGDTWEEALEMYERKERKS